MSHLASVAIVVLVQIIFVHTTEDVVPGLRSLTEYEMRMSEEAGHTYVDRLAQLEEELLRDGHYVKSGSPFYSMSQFKRANPEAHALNQKALRMLEASRFLKNELGLTNDESGQGLRQATSSLVTSTCLTVTTCTSTSKYRTMNGTCNNLNVTNLGAANTDYRRFTTPTYSDGIQTPRLAVSGSALPSARNVSLIVFNNDDIALSTGTLAIMQFGQFINHDMESTPTVTYSNGTAITCCTTSGASLSASQLHPSCLPISIPVDDKFFNKPVYLRNCMNFVRSAVGPRLDCSLGYADQLNSITHWLDASTVYGSSDSQMATLRSFKGGLLLMTNDTVNKRYLLPQTSPCTTNSCYFCGDSRCTEQPQLTVMHTIWAREHNRIANKLSSLNPTWNDETIFQEARRIVIAEVQHITYNEYLPSILSPATISKYGLTPLTSGFSTNYNSSIQSGPISNEFAAAAFRMGHSMVQGVIQLFNSSGALTTTYNMSSYFNNPSLITTNVTFFDSIIRGLMLQPAQSADQQVMDDLWNFLFRNATFKPAFDIVALNIQRGRDHGLPSYNTYRQLCGLSKLNSFSDLTTALNGTLNRFTVVNQPTPLKQIAAFLAKSYVSVDDIDLYVGGLSESPVSGGVLGPTFSCLIGENFSQLKNSDRFFYEVGSQPGSFTAAQLTEIRKSSMARIFCDNSDGTVSSAQPKAFVMASGTNAAVPCSAIPSLDLTLWK